MEITSLSLSELSSRLSDRSLSSREITSAYLQRIDLENPSISAICHILTESALLAADQSDERWTRGIPRSMFDGIPFAIKDILCTKGIPTTCGSRYLEKFIPPYNATVVEKLLGAGLVMLGKANLDEFAMGGSTETSIFGVTRNPWDLARTPGGSSGGSAAAVAARMAPFSIGTDTGGSIRQPAAYCGVCGIKPTYGRVSRYGLVAFASSLDSVGAFANSAADLGAVYSLIAGHDPLDSTSINHPSSPISFSNPIATLPFPLRVGIVREHLDHEGLDEEVRKSILQAIDLMKSAGAEIVELSLPHSHYGVPTYYIIAPSEASSNLSRYDGAHYGHRSSHISNRNASEAASPLIDMYCRSRSEGFGPEVKRRIMLGTYTLSSGYYDAYYLKALRVRRLIRRDYDEAFSKVDVLLGPTTPGPAFPLGAKIDDPVQMYLEDWYTVGANLAGIPAISIPCGKMQSGLPIGMQLQAPPLAEEKLLQVAHWYQTTIDYKPMHPSDDPSNRFELGEGKGSR